MRLIHTCLKGLGALLVGLSLTGAAVAQGQLGSGSTSPRAGAGSSHVVRGKIFLPSGGLPEQRMRVVLEINSGGVAAETFSDSVGNFEFRSLATGSYRIVIPTDGRIYDTTQEAVEVSGSISRTYNVQLYLRPKSSNNEVQPAGKMISAGDFLQDVPKAAKKHYEQGLKRAKDGHAEEAITSFNEALKVFPDYVMALNRLGEQKLSLGQQAEAQAAFERAVTVNPKYVLSQINLGVILLQLKRFPEAIEHLSAANRIDESYPVAHLYLGVAMMESGPAAYVQAERELLKAVALSENGLPMAHKYLFNLYLRQKAYDKGIAQLEAYLKESPNAPDAAGVREALEKVKRMAANQAPKP